MMNLNTMKRCSLHKREQLFNPKNRIQFAPIKTFFKRFRKLDSFKLKKNVHISKTVCHTKTITR